MSPWLADDGATAFVVLLVVLLAMMLAAVIRSPESPGLPEPDARPQPSPAAPSRPVDVQARAAATIARAAVVLPAGQPPGPRPDDIATIPVPTVAASPPRQGSYAARHASGPVPRAGAVPRQEVSGGPPWEPAPEPSAISEGAPGPAAGYRT